MNPIIIERRRDCIVQDGVRYCEDERMTPAQWGTVLLLLVLLFVWALVPIILINRLGGWFQHNAGMLALLWYVGTPTLLGIWLVIR